MARALSLSICRVPAELETEYLATIRELARHARRRGQHLWAFRSRNQPHTFVECSESASAALHRTVVEKSTEEAQLERRLRTLAQYEASAWDLWEEVPLEPGPGGVAAGGA
ncbi:MAG: hypothetical protein NW201_15450 [Gemmatimonadales bacterium]|nr:hypothetical protein [Gemmatimonadales bacterium]